MHKKNKFIYFLKILFTGINQEHRKINQTDKSQNLTRKNDFFDENDPEHDPKNQNFQFL